MVDENAKFFINPTGRFVIGGPHGDSGLTGRKIIVILWGRMARHGGGTLRKRPLKVDVQLMQHVMLLRISAMQGGQNARS